MPYFDPNPRIISQSLEELSFIFNWVRERGETSEDPVTVLIGGWAVDAYNSWYGSVDIDLVTNSKIKNSLKNTLKKNRGYGTYKVPGENINTVSKQTDYGEIIIDFIPRKTIKFEGGIADFDFNIPNRQTEEKEIRGGVLAIVPNRSLLLLLKLKAIWDRTYRIRSSRCHDEGWERGKLVKDYADILALIDPEYGGAELEIELLGTKLDELGFLKNCLENIPENIEAIRKYGRISQDKVRDTTNRLLSLIR